MTDPRGAATSTEGDFKTRFSYDGRDMRTHVIDGENRDTEYKRREDGKVSSIIKPKGSASDAAGDYETKLDYWPTGEVRSRSIPWAEGQYGSKDLKVSYDINAVGDPETITDPRGKTITNTFLDSGELASTSRASWWLMAGDQVTERSPDQPGEDGTGGEKPEGEGHGDFGAVNRTEAPGLLPKAGRASFSYDDELRLTGVTDAADKTTTLTRDPLGRLTQTRRPLDGTRDIVEKSAYDFNGNLAKTTDPAGESTTRSYDQFDRVKSETRPGSNLGDETTEISYDENGNPKVVQTPRGPSVSTSYDYDALDRQIREQDGEGNVTTRDYDRAGNVVMERSPRGNADNLPAGQQRSDFESRRDYNADSELTKLTNGAGHEWQFEYDRNGNQTKIDAPGAQRGPGEEAKRRVTDRSYDGRDLPWTETTGSGDNGGDDRKRTRVTEYDPNGYLRRVVNPAGVDSGTGRPQFSYTSDAQVTSDPAAAKEATVYDYGATDPSLRTSKRLPWGDRDAQDSKRYRQDFGYDSRGRIETIDPPHEGTPNPDGRTTYGYFDTGWVKSAKDKYQTISYDYDGRGDQTVWESDGGRKMTRSYWPSGKLKARAGRKGESGDLRRYTYEYDKNRSMSRMVDSGTNMDSAGDDRETGYGYDQADRQVKVDEKSFEVDGDTRRGKDTALAYDENDNVLVRRTDGRYDSGASYVGGKTARFSYDSLDREQSMAVAAPDEPDRRTSTDWWDSGARKQRITNRSDTSKNTIEREFFFSDGRMSRMDRRREGAGADDFAKNQSYAYDANGNRTKDERGSHVFNSRDQLTKWTKKNGAATSYTLNGSGAIQSESKGAQTTTFNYAPDGERLLSAQSDGTTTTYRYDEGLGEITGYSAAGQSGTTFSYDQFGRKKLDKSGDDPATTYSYDGLDRRDTKTQGGKTFDFSYVGSSESLSQEQQFGGSEVRSYDYDASMDREGMARRDGGAGAKYRAYSKDANGSVEGLENDQGEIPANERYGYDPYGKAQGAEGSDPNATDPKPSEVEQGLSDDAKANPFRFEGHYADTSTQTYDMQARPYLPEVGRFLTEDRYESAAGDLSLESDTLTQDRYAFAGGNPVNNIELDGHFNCGPSISNGPCQNKTAKERRAPGSPSNQQARRNQLASQGVGGQPHAPGGQDVSPARGRPLDRSAPARPKPAQAAPTPQARPKPVQESGVVGKAFDFVNKNTIDAKVEDSGCFDPRKSCQAVSLFGNDPKEAGIAAGSSLAGGIIGKGAAKGGSALCARYCSEAGERLRPLGRLLSDERGSIGGRNPKPTGRASKLGRDPNAEGSHTRFARDANSRISKYTTFDESGNELFRFRGTGRSHGPFDPPLVLERASGKGSGARPNRARKPAPEELPDGY